MTSGHLRVELTTTIRAARERVFDAWLSRERLGRFLCAGDTHVARIDVDPRVGGEFRVVMADERGSYEHRGRYLEIERPARLRFTWTSTATHGAETIVTLTFEDIPEGTRLTLVHAALPDEGTIARHERGWHTILQKLERAFADV